MSKSHIGTWDIRAVIDGLKSGRLVMPPFTRSHGWGNDRKYALVDSLLHGFPIGALVVESLEDGTARLVDGRQRCATVIEYVDGEVGWTEGAPADGMLYTTYEALEDAARKRFLETQLPVTVLERVEWQDVKNVYIRAQMGVSLGLAETAIAFRAQEKSTL